MFFADFYMEESIPKFSEFDIFSMTFFFPAYFSICFIIFYRLSPPGRALDPRGSKKKSKKKKLFLCVLSIFSKIVHKLALEALKLVKTIKIW